MKIKHIKRADGTLRVKHYCDEKSLTDQSSKKMCDINLIMKQYQKTGLLPNFSQKIGQYLDISDVPSFEEAHDIVTEARSLFLELPSKIRKLMDNNPANLENFVLDPKNIDILVKEGLMEKRIEEKQKVSQDKASESAQAQSSDQK